MPPKNQKISWVNSAISITWLFLCAWQIGDFSSVAAGSPSSFQLATGEWDVSIRGGYWLDASLIFPCARKPNASSCAEPSATTESSAEFKPLVKRRFWGSSLDCTLSLASDGTFILSPKQVISINDEQQLTSSHSLVENTSSSESEQERQQGILDLRGSWDVLTNPYCLTDRFYDQVSLKSYPRQQIPVTTKEGSNLISEGDPLRTIQLKMNCRMWGRHHPQRQRLRSGKYKMTHGTFTCEDHNVPWWKGLYRPVVASFSAVRSSSEPTHEGWIDMERFGY